MNALIPTPYPSIRGRPMFISYEKGRIWILFHDHYHLRTKRHLIKKIRAIHPDTRKKGLVVSDVRVCQLVTLFHKWQDAEIQWYAQLDLYPPTGKVVFRLPGKAVLERPALRANNPRIHWMRRHWSNRPAARPS